MATHSSILALRILWGAWGTTVLGVAESDITEKAHTIIGFPAADNSEMPFSTVKGFSPYFFYILLQR